MMEVDPPTSAAPAPGALKRSNSAPMINVLVGNNNILASPKASSTCGPLSPSLNSSSLSPGGFRPLDSHRQRRYSASSTALYSSAAPIRTPSRLHQIKHEESMHVGNREAAHEREVQSAMQMSQSWEELSLDDAMHTDAPTHKRPRSFSETLNPLHIFTGGFPVTSSPSPNRLGSKQCFSPSLQQPVISAFSPSPSPSPTRKTFPRRSLSPIVSLKPSSFGHLSGKRKLDPDCESYFSPPKRLMHSTPTQDRSMAHPLTQSVSSNNFNGCLDQMGSGRGTVCPAVSTAGMAYTFTPVQVYSHTSQTDSEASDTTEMTDTSEGSEVQHTESPRLHHPGISGSETTISTQLTTSTASLHTFTLTPSNVLS